MNDYTQLINSINQTIKKNGNKEITGDILNAILKLIADYSKNNFENIRDVIQNIADDENIGIVGSISPNDILNNLPDGFYLPTTAGTYTNMGGLVVKDGYFTIISKVGTTYKIASEVKMPEYDDTELINRLDTKLDSNSNKILPNGYNYIENDRPDLVSREIIIVDSDNYYLPNNYVEKVDLENYVQSNSNKILPNGYNYIENDRPDLIGNLITVDSNNLYIDNNVVNLVQNFIKDAEYKYFGEIEGYDVETVKDLDFYYNQWNELVDNEYVKRTSLNPSTLRSLPIYRYDFKPTNPKIKVLLTGCTHGWEKNFSFGLRIFMKQLVEDWRGNDLLTYLRANVHFIVVPVVSPEPFTANPFNGNVRVRDRTAYETLPINALFRKEGNLVTLTFNESDFPTTNPNVRFEDYFTAYQSQIEGKIGVTLFDSSDSTEIPTNAYTIQRVISNNAIIIQTPNTASSVINGTVKLVVKVDPNRNSFTSYWNELRNSNTLVGYPPAFYDNKGTKPFSLIETMNIKKIIDENQDISYYYDMHSGAGDYLTYIVQNIGSFDESLNVIRSYYQSTLNITPNYQPSINSTMYRYAVETYGITGATPEWHAPEVQTGVMDKEQATELHQWIGNLLYTSSKFNILLKK